MRMALLAVILLPLLLSAQTPSLTELQAQVRLLVQQIKALETERSLTPFSYDMGVGTTGSQVVTLQQFLAAKGYLVMPAGVAYGYYGNLTSLAVKKFQSAYAISSTGFVGPLTRTRLNALRSGTIQTNVVTRSTTSSGSSQTTSGTSLSEAPTSAPTVPQASPSVSPSPLPTPAPVPAPTPTPTPTPTTSTEPMYQEGTNTSLIYDNFNTRTSSESIRSSYTTLGENSIHADNTAGMGGTNAIRFDWPASSSCQDDSKLLEWSFPSTNEIYVQYSVRYQNGFVFDWVGRGGCTGNAKKLFLIWAQSGSRFDFISENHTLGMGSDYDHPLHQQNVGAPVSVEALADGAWHRITFHIKQSSTPSAEDGFIHGWIDGVEKWSHANIPTHNSGGYYLFKVPATFNQGSPVPQSEWMDDFRIWR